MNFEIHRLFETASTNDDAKLAAEAGAVEGAVFWALRQSAGRGRRGRQWVSPEGNLYCSVLLRPKLAPKNYGHYSFVAALALADVVRAALPSALVELKWPNDVLVNGKKISGILLEAGDGYLIIGMGLNVRHYPENPLYPVTSLAAENRPTPPLDFLLDQLLHALGHWSEILNTTGFDPIRVAWCAQARKGALSVRLPDGEISGQFQDLDSDGHLGLLLADGTIRSINTGDVFL
jgi:BirA family biotin operon repressor/biotin-[acetyl-CoA-carboxylase] ligase